MVVVLVFGEELIVDLFNVSLIGLREERWKFLFS